MTVSLCFYAQFVASKVGLDGLSPTVDVERITRANSTRSALVTAGAVNIAIGRRGLYGYRLDGADLTLYDYVATFVSTDATVDQQEIAAMWTEWILPSVAQTGDSFARLGAAGAGLTALGDTRLANLDAAVGSRATVAQVNVVLARIGAFTGAGLSTIMGWLRAIMSKASGLTPGDVGGTFSNVTDSTEAIRDKLTSSTITVTGPVVTTDGDVVTYRGDTYLDEDGRAIEWESDDWPDLTGGSVKVIIAKQAQFNGTVVTPVGTVKVRLELTAVQSLSISTGRHNFQVVATQADGDVATLVAAAWVSRARAQGGV